METSLMSVFFQKYLYSGDFNIAPISVRFNNGNHCHCNFIKPDLDVNTNKRARVHVQPLGMNIIAKKKLVRNKDKIFLHKKVFSFYIHFKRVFKFDTILFS